jgi:DNA-binding CsgD family transcriptional regulator
MNGTQQAPAIAHAYGSDIADYARQLVLRDLKRSEFIHELRRELHRLGELTSGDVHVSIKRIVHTIDSLEHHESSWNDFMTYFDQIHGGFLTRLSARHPELTETELRICAFLRLPMTSKDVASIMGCSTRSVEKHRERLRKKFGLTPTQRIHEYLNTTFTTPK